MLQHMKIMYVYWQSSIRFKLAAFIAINLLNTISPSLYRIQGKYKE